MNLNNYLIDHNGFDWETLLKEWRWLLPPKFSVWLFTRAGDLFIELPEGSIHMLEVGAGELRRVAENREDARAKLEQPDVAADWLMIPVVDQLAASGCLPGPGQCYSYKMLPILGGNYSPEGRALLPVHEHFGAWGSLHRQVSTLPDGAQIRIEVTD